VENAFIYNLRIGYLAKVQSFYGREWKIFLEMWNATCEKVHLRVYPKLQFLKFVYEIFIKQAWALCKCFVYRWAANLFRPTLQGDKKNV